MCIIKFLNFKNILNTIFTTYFKVISIVTNFFFSSMDKNTRANREKEKNWLLEHFYKLVIDVSYLSRTRSNRIFGARSIPIISIFINQTNFKSIYFARYLENFGINKKEEVSFNKESPSHKYIAKLVRKFSPEKSRGTIAWNEARSRMETERKTMWLGGEGREGGKATAL